VVTARTAELGERVLRDATEDAVEPPKPNDTRALIGFWHLTDHGPRRVERMLPAAPWAQIRRNYSSEAGASLERLLTVDPGRLSGRLLLLHGPPGTGKTTAVRAVAHAWRSWCQVDFVVDPERLLSSTQYLLRVALSSDPDPSDETADTTSPPRFRLLVLEDCDELVQGDAKQRTGQGLARLLNLTDGLIGQGLRLLVCLTTNEQLSQLHPAIIRPGRCLAQIHVGALPPDEAAAWLGSAEGVDRRGVTLAELYARKGVIDQIAADRPDEPIGLYL
jgi:hypothetical protein